ncbi:MAG: RNA polymerase sigma factor [Steroidobacteraceae bacterium]
MSPQEFAADMAAPAHHALFGELLERYQAPIARLAGAYEPRRADREDLVQDIWLALWRALPGFRGECSERTFVYRIAHNRAITHAGRRQPDMAGLDEAPELPDPTPAAEAVVGAHERHARLLAALRRLPLIQRETVTLCLEGLSHRDVADVLGTTPANVAVRLSRARAELTRLLDTDGG